MRHNTIVIVIVSHARVTLQSSRTYTLDISSFHNVYSSIFLNEIHNTVPVPQYKINAVCHVQTVHPRHVLFLPHNEGQNFSKRGRSLTKFSSPKVTFTMTKTMVVMVISVLKTSSFGLETLLKPGPSQHSHDGK